VGKIFHRLVEQLVVHKAKSYNEIIESAKKRLEWRGYPVILIWIIKTMPIFYMLRFTTASNLANAHRAWSFP